MARNPVNLSALHEMRAAVSEAHKLIREAREAPDDAGKLAEVENRLNRLQAGKCPFMIFA